MQGKVFNKCMQTAQMGVNPNSTPICAFCKLRKYCTNAGGTYFFGCVQIVQHAQTSICHVCYFGRYGWVQCILM